MPKRPTQNGQFTGTGTSVGLCQSSRQKDTTSQLSQIGMKDGFKKRSNFFNNMPGENDWFYQKLLFNDHLSKVNPLEVNR